MAKKVLIGVGGLLLVLVAAFAVLAMIAPTQMHVEREIAVDLPKDAVFEELKFVKNHAVWSPWFKLDPHLKKEYEGEDGRVGFVMSWSGNDKVGAGEQEIAKIREGERIDYELRFKKPMEGTNKAYLITEAAGETQTKVRWGMDGAVPVPFNVLCYVMGMRDQVAGQFDEGLADLKQHLEKQPETPSEAEQPPAK